MLVAPLLATGIVAVGTIAAAAPAKAATDPCVAPVNVIACENTKPGAPSSEWDVSGQGDTSIQGFATDMSVNVGTTVSFKVMSPATYTMDIYRLGYYQGNGARKIVSVPTTPRNQPTCTTENATHLIDCGNWSVSASWAVPSTAVSGVYIAHLVRTDTGGDSQIPFVVRNDASTSAIVMQTSDTTWQAYNNWGGDQFFDGGANLYGGPNYTSSNRAYKISYNRPFQTRSWEGGRDYLFSNEYPMIRFLEQNGYDVSYLTGLDTDRSAALIKQHKVMLTAGHDEYWSGQQRANVQSAVDAGVSMAFFTGNDMYWKTRYEASTASTDGSPTARRTLVSYKETWAGAKIDPTSTWTGTWRDPRFSPPADGGLPENALVGTAFMSNISDLPITVSAEEGKMRIWRGTALANQSAGSSTALAAHTVGYESNEDLDNGFRPAGTIDMSTTTGPSAARLTDFGLTVAAGTTTHHITQYRAASGALVFSAGSVQWAWGLDQDHDGNGAAADPRIQQATVNLLADMGAPATTLMSGLTAATKSADTTKPTSTITSPAANATIANGTKVTVTGTATDVGGVVGGVEVSGDGGTTWHPATGKANWTYSFIASGSGSVAIKSRATDDSGNIETPGAGRTVSMTCPCSLFGAAVPATPDAGDTSDVEVGVKVKPTASGYITGLRFYKSAANTGTHTGTLWSSAGTALATGTFTNETASGWQTLTFPTPVAVTSGTTYVASYRAPKGHYAADSYALSVRDWVAGPLTAPRSVAGAGNGVYANGGVFPTDTYHDENYYVDVSFTTVNTSPPSVVTSSPRSAQVGVAANSVVTATFADAINTGTAQIAVKTAAGATVAGAVTYDATSKTAKFIPTAALAASTSYTVTVSGATSNSGVTMTPTSWSFTTDSSATCPCSLFGTTSVPTTVDSADTDSLELGVRFSPSVDGFVSGVKFYKATANTGTHTGTLWSSTGTALATGTFTNETASGWQTLVFTSPVAVTAGASYTASYLAPSGHYSADSNFFATPYTSGQLTAPATNNGVYVYSAGGVAPTSTFGATNYWVDPLFQTTASAPSVTTTAPASGATGVAVGTTVSATFSAAMQSGTGTFTVTGPGGAVTGAVTLSSDGKTFVFTPSGALTASTTYTATITGAKNTFGVTMSGSTTWTFTTAGAATCPCSLFSPTSVPTTPDVADGSSVELGVRFSPSAAGFISGVKFFKSAANSGTHTGTLWSSNGTALATGTFTNESASGWQTLVFDSPVAVTAGTTYTASYLAPNGHYSGDANYFTSAVSTSSLVAPATNNGVYIYGRGGTAPTSSYNATNYWVDVLFTTTSTPPSVASTSPASGATGAPVSTTVSAVFSTALQAGTATVTVTKSGGAAVAGATTLAADNKTVVFTPSAALDNSATYTASVSGAKSSSGVAMTGTTTWSFTTVAAATCPCSLFTSTSTPATVDSGDTSSVELGVRIKPTVNGTISAIKFYKATTNTGTHTGTLWSATGAVLATGTFTNETASGWQTLTFATPVTVTAGTVYTASYKAPSGHYSVNAGYFNTDYSTPALIAPAAGGNGVYAYGNGGTFPANTYNGSNYWVDVVLNSGTATPDTTPPVVTAVNATGSGTTGTVTWTTDEASSSTVQYGTSAATLNLTATTAGNVTAHSVALTGLTAGTPYYYRVVSADAVGNTTTSPATTAAAATFTPAATTATTVSYNSAAEFGTGTVSAAYVGPRDGGEVITAPTSTDEFPGTALSGSWTTTSLATGSAVTVANNQASVSGRFMRSSSTYASGRSLDVVATLRPVNNQWIGFASTDFTGTTSHWAAFHTTSTGGLVAETRYGGGLFGSGAATVSTTLSSSFLGAPHRYTVDWTTNTVTYSIDGTVVATQNRTTTANMYAAFRDATVDTTPLLLDSVWVTPYASNGTWTSPVIDPGASATLGALTATATTPTGTGITYAYRAAATTTALASAAYTTVTPGTTIGATNRYFQIRATLTTGATGSVAARTLTPTLSALSVTYAK